MTNSFVPLPLLVSIYVQATGIPLCVVHLWLKGGKIAPAASDRLIAVKDEVELAARAKLAAETLRARAAA